MLQKRPYRAHHLLGERRSRQTCWCYKAVAGRVMDVVLHLLLILLSLTFAAFNALNLRRAPRGPAHLAIARFNLETPSRAHVHARRRSRKHIHV